MASALSFRLDQACSMPDMHVTFHLLKHNMEAAGQCYMFRQVRVAPKPALVVEFAFTLAELLRTATSATCSS